MIPPRVALVGLGGYGRVHLQHLREAHERGELVLAAAVAFPPEPPAAEAAALLALGCAVVHDFDELRRRLPVLRLDLVVVPTPIHLHARMTIALVEAGVDVLVEKPLAAMPEDAVAIAAAAQRTHRLVAVGFQYLHAPEVRALKQKLLAGAIGPLRRLVVHAAWPRSHAYYARNAWAGRLRLGEDWVLDSPASNAMSHFLMLMLYLAGRNADALARPVRLAAELYRAQAIESFDTAVLRFETAEGLRLDFYGTHSAAEVSRPALRIEGEHGTAEWMQDSYAQLSGPQGEWRQEAAPEADTRERMLRDVLARRRGEGALVCTPEMGAAHVACIAALHRAVAIAPVPSDRLARQRRDDETFTYVPGLDKAFAVAAQQGRSLVDVGVPWAVAPTSVRLPFA